MAYHLASYHSPTAPYGGLHQALCARPSDHSNPNAVIDNDMVQNLNVKNKVIATLTKALDIAIASLAAQDSSTQAEKLQKLANDDRFEITYTGQNVAATTPSGRVRYSETPDYKQKIANIADILLESQDTSAQRSKALESVRDQISQQMYSIGAQSQLPPGWYTANHEG